MSITVPLTGEIDHATAPSVLAYIRSALAHAVDPDPEIILDLVAVEFMNSAGLNLLAVLRSEGYHPRCINAHGAAALVLTTEEGQLLSGRF